MVGDFSSNKDLPKQVRESMDEDEQDTYRLAYNNAVAAGKTTVEARAAGRRAVGVLRQQVNA